MSSEEEYRNELRRVTDEWEHDDASEPKTKRVLLYGWEGSAKVRIAVTSAGTLKVTT